MFGRIGLPMLCVALAAMAPHALAQGNGNGNGNGNGPAACNKPNPPPNNPHCRQIALSIESDIDFGRLVLLGTGIGQVWLDLATGERFVTGGLDDAGGMPVTGRAIVTGRPLEPIRIEFPDTVTMTDPSGGVATLRDFTTDLPSLPILDSTGQLEFRFSGTLHTDSNSPLGGRLRGRVPITVDYD